MSRFIAMCGDHHLGACKDKTEKEFDTLEEAIQFLEKHIKEERSEGCGHHGDTRAKVVELVDEDLARVVARHQYKGPGEEKPDINKTEEDLELRRGSGDKKVGDVLQRGDLIERNWGHKRKGKVVSVRENEDYGITNYSIVYVPSETEPNKDGSYPKKEKKYINDLVYQDGEIRKLEASREDIIKKIGRAERKGQQRVGDFV